MDERESVGLGESERAVAAALGADDAELARVIEDHAGGLVLIGVEGRVNAVWTGRLRHAVEHGAALAPRVGDWVLASVGTSPRGVTHVLPRRGALVRHAPGRAAEPQVLAANVDLVLVVCALGRDVRARRIERWTTLAFDGGAQPHIVLSKADLFEDVAEYVAVAESAAPGCRVHVVSATTGAGLDALNAALPPRATIALLGTSGAGKSTLVNALLGHEALTTGAVRDRDGKGRHTTTSRSLVALGGGRAVIDTPGLREVGMWTGDAGLGDAFEDVEALAAGCHFTDCGHGTEPRCAVRAALRDGTLTTARFEAFLQLRDEIGAMQARSVRTKRNERVMSKALRARLKDKGRID